MGLGEGEVGFGAALVPGFSGSLAAEGRALGGASALAPGDVEGKVEGAEVELSAALVVPRVAVVGLGGAESAAAVALSETGMFVGSAALAGRRRRSHAPAVNAKRPVKKAATKRGARLCSRGAATGTLTTGAGPRKEAGAADGGALESRCPCEPTPPRGAGAAATRGSSERGRVVLRTGSSAAADGASATVARSGLLCGVNCGAGRDTGFTGGAAIGCALASGTVGRTAGCATGAGAAERTTDCAYG